MYTDQPNESHEYQGLSRAGRENPFTVPAGYFEALPGVVARRVPARGREARVLPLGLRRSLAYAAAACVAVALLFGGIYFSGPYGGADQASQVLTYEQLGNSTLFMDFDETMLSEEWAAYTTDSRNTDIENYLIDHAADISGYYLENL